jgi:primosomal protein N' (replication factor Y) (superfamily II helicase)
VPADADGGGDASGADDPEPPRYARVIVDVAPAHLDRPFDYLIPPGLPLEVGQQVRVVFAGRRRTAWVVDLADRTDTPAERVRELSAVDGDSPWFDVSDLRLYRWVATRYGAILADVLRHALPRRIAAVEREPALKSEVSSVPGSRGRPPCAVPAWKPYDASALLRATAERDRGAPAVWLRVLPGDDPAALVTDLVSRTLSSGRGVLVLAPDPASPLPDAALSVAGRDGADWRTDSERNRYRAFLRGRRGVARVVVGERSGVFAPVPDLGLIVVDDEANPAYKERRSPRHHVREVALARARMAGATCVLLGDLPSANLARLLVDRHVDVVAGDRVTERRRAPRIEVVDLSDPRPGTRRARFSAAAAGALTEVTGAGGAAVVLASRGGQGAALVCRGCRRRLTCPVCAGSLSVQRDGDDWRCPACDWVGPAFVCPDCGDDRFAPLAAGAGRLAAELRRSHPDAEVVRMEGFDAPGPTRRPAIGVMTRGSVVDRPRWLRGGSGDVVVIPDADAMLLRPGYDAAEDALRLWFAVARWTTRVVLQTREPNHHAVQALVRWDAPGFWERELDARQALQFPPAASLIRLRAVAAQEAVAMGDQVRAALDGHDVLGPDLDGAVLVKTTDLHGTLAALAPVREDWGRRDFKVRVDVDPLL